MTQSASYHGFARLGHELSRRWREPLNHPTFVFYFFGSFVLFGGLGIWLEILKYFLATGAEAGSTVSLRTAIATYFPALVGGTALQLAISDQPRSIRAIGFLLSPILLVIAAVIILDHTLPGFWALTLGFISSACALWWWWVVNADEPDFLDEPPPEVATGNQNPEAPLLGEAELNEFDA